MKGHKAYWLPVIAVLLVAPLILGCVGREDIASILEQADTLAKDDPKKAIALVTSYNYNNNNDMRAHAYYTHALSQQRYNNLPMAALMLNGAAKALESYHNPSLEGSVYSTLGDIYFKNILYSNSYDYYSHAAECFSKAGLENEQYLALRNKGWSAFKLHRYDEAKHYLNLVYEYSTQQDDRELSVDILQKLCDIYLYTKDIAKLNSSIELLDDYTDSIDNLLSYYCLKSIVCSLNNDIDNAIHYIECAKSHGVQHSPYIKRAEHYIYRCTGEDAKSIERLIRGFNPWPSAYTELDGKNLKLYKAEVLEDISSLVGAADVNVGEIAFVDKKSFVVKTGSGYLKVLELQLAGKKRMECDAFLRGHKLEAGAKLGA
jgi:tetratricopeptide (TPR) repeat protein